MMIIQQESNVAILCGLPVAILVLICFALFVFLVSKSAISSLTRFFPSFLRPAPVPIKQQTDLNVFINEGTK